LHRSEPPLWGHKATLRGRVDWLGRTLLTGFCIWNWNIHQRLERGARASPNPPMNFISSIAVASKRAIHLTKVTYLPMTLTKPAAFHPEKNGLAVTVSARALNLARL
jgi:hypothetical protein